VLKRRLEEVLEKLIAPMRERRASLATDRGYVRRVLDEGTAHANDVTQETLRAVRQTFALAA
jgi:tryptophanyl-tRNA synthetase